MVARELVEERAVDQPDEILDGRPRGAPLDPLGGSLLLE